MNTIFLLYKTVVIILLIYITARVIKWFVNRWTINKIPGPYSHFFIGNIFDMTGTPEKLFKQFRLFASKYKTYRLWMGYVGIVNLRLPEDIEAVISSTDNLTKSELYWPLLPWLGTGLLTSTGQKWHNRRRILTPAFHFSILQRYVNIFTYQTTVLLEALEQHINEPYIDIVPFVTEFTLHSITETAMGTRLDATDTEQRVYKESIYEFSKVVVYRSLRPWLYDPLIWNLHPMYRQEQQLVKTLHSFTSKIINQRKMEFDCGIMDKSLDTKTSKTKNSSMLDLLLSSQEAGLGIDKKDIREEVDTFTFEGHDTTSTSISFTLLLLASHGDIQEKVYQEIMGVIDNTAKLPTFHNLQNLKYLERCIKESLRLYPSVPLISRTISKDLVTSEGYKLTKGTPVIIHIYDLHHDPDIYPDPEKFNPDRFLSENIAKRHPFAYLPFSGGPRNCIGQKFAMLELKSIISGILRKYRLKTIDNVEEIVMAQQMVIRPKDGIRLKFEARS